MQRGSTLFILVIAALAVSAFAERGHGRDRGQNRRGSFRNGNRQSQTQENTNAGMTANSENRPRFGQREENERGNRFGQMSDRRFDGQRFGGQDNGNVNAEEAGVSRPTGLRGGEGRNRGNRFGQMSGRQFDGNRYDNTEETDTNTQDAQSLGEGRKPWGPGGRDGPDRHHHHHRHHHGRRNETEGDSESSQEGLDGDEAGNFTRPFRFRPFGRKPFGRHNDTEDSDGPFDGEGRLNSTRGQHGRGHFKPGGHYHERSNETDMEGRDGDKRPSGRGFFGNRGGRPFGGKVHNDEEAVEGTQAVEPLEPQTVNPEPIFPEILDTEETVVNGNNLP